LNIEKCVLKLKTRDEIKKIKIAGEVASDLLYDKLDCFIKPGISTKSIDDFSERYIRSFNMVPAFLGIKNIDGSNNFPASVCISVNDEIVHGIPNDSKILKYGDIVSVDVGIIYNGYYCDAARTYAVGEIDCIAKKLIDVTELSLYNGIYKMLSGNKIGDISNAIQKTVEKHGFFIIKDLVGHGIGKSLHEYPQVPNYGKSGVGVKLFPGTVLAIEPMVSVSNCGIFMLDDLWTIVTNNGSLSAHFEHTVAITDNGYEILTKV
jgi:methionyl aminopeptidase